MTYLLEQLGDERFQHLCQAILLTDYPNLQCLPVGQPDGGRDAFQKNISSDEVDAEIVVFQVKYVTDPKNRDAKDQIEKVISSEGPKISKLIERGMKKYFLMTNAQSSSHLDVGSVDRLNKLLSNELGIEAQCWWRDDIERRIDAKPEIKWSFPEIIRAQDLLKVLLHSKENAASERQESVTRSYLAHQERADSKLKFKQVELQKNIAELFVDVPARVMVARDINGELLQPFWNVEKDRPDSVPDIAAGMDESEPSEHQLESTLGAMTLLSLERFADTYPMVVIEGAPGQGKSTITQYLCQVHRWILLDRVSDMKLVEEQHRPTNVRIPFRVDLRDYATWLSGQNPFSLDVSSRESAISSPRLEAFLAAQVHWLTGQEFSASDLVDVSRSSQLLFVLDGFDEVANVELRRRIVVEASEAYSRFVANALSVQFIVTSRPAAFANSPGFPREEWQHVQLLSMSKAGIMQYGEKWLRVSSASDREKSEVLDVLQGKLSQPHVRELARNPMQLAILLALISFQGASLPDKRTALYENYVDIFLNRESEKSAVVRKHRTLISRIHQYVAWLLQVEAETEKGSGNITESRLRDEVRRYLEVREHSTDLVDELFRGMVERVFVLVSRIQGTLEFEVQPLREYFAAKYLYETAPLSTSGKHIAGALPDRFKALAKNSYWLNVTRFYSGCYSSGELASLSEGMEEVLSSAEFRYSAHIPRLATIISSDFVFNQQPRLAKKIVSNLVCGSNFRLLLAKQSRGFFWEPFFSFPPGIANDEFIQGCASALSTCKNADEIGVITNVLGNIFRREDAVKVWRDLEEKISSEKNWISLGVSLGMYRYFSEDELIEFIERYGLLHPSKSNSISGIVFHATYFDIVTSPERCNILGQAFFALALRDIVQTQRLAYGVHANRKHGITAYTALNSFFSLFFFKKLTEKRSGSGRRKISMPRHHNGLRSIEEKIEPMLVQIDAPRMYLSLASNVDLFLDGSSKNRDSMLVEYVAVLQKLVEEFGFNFSIYAIVAEATDSISEGWLSEDEGGISDLLRSGAETKKNIEDADWWRHQCNSTDMRFLSPAFLTFSAFRWMSFSGLVELSVEIDYVLKNMDDGDWEQFCDLLNAASAATFGSNDIESDAKGLNIEMDADIDLPADISFRFICLLTMCLRGEERIGFWEKHLSAYSQSDSVVLRVSQDCAIESLRYRPDAWRDVLRNVLHAYANEVPWWGEEIDGIEVPSDISEIICSDADKFPMALVAWAEESASSRNGSLVRPVGEIAVSEGWKFSD